MSSNLYDPNQKGGLIASRLESQDTVAAVLALEALGRRMAGLLPHIDPNDILILCENSDDLEFRWPQGVQYVQVKDQLLSLAALRRQFVRAERLLANHGEASTYRVSALRGLDSAASSLAEDCDHLRGMFGDGVIYKDLQDKAECDFRERWNIEPECARRVYVDSRDLGRESVSCRAIFAHAVRMTFPVQGYTDGDLVRLLGTLVEDSFGPARRGRGAVPLLQIRQLILSRIAPTLTITHQSDYIRTAYGYYVDSERRKAFAVEEGIARRARRRLMRKWRRYIWLDVVRSVLLGPIACPACNHPMMANIYGLRGYLCPDCRFMPFASVFYACDCGDAILLMRQPDIAAYRIYSDLIDITRASTLRCPTCQSLAEPQKLNTRILLLPIPWPFDQSIGKRLIALRESIGHQPHHPLPPSVARKRILDGVDVIREVEPGPGSPPVSASR